MAELKGKSLGIFWGRDSLYFIDSDQGSPRRIAVLPFENEMMQKAQNNSLSPEGTKTIAAIQDALRKNKIKHNLVNLSLPSRDIIFRSFIVPWMQSKEIKSVVEFEATKYIPFTLKELAYSYHAMNIMIENSRRLRIIFVAIKKDVLKKHTKLLEEAALKIKQVEPAPISLIRALVKKQKFHDEEVVALIEKGENSGKIVIVQENTPLFVREFQLTISSNPALDQTVDSAEVLRLTNEIRISLDYFGRQEKHINVERIIYIGSGNNDEEYAKMLEEDLEIPAEAVSAAQVLDNQQRQDPNMINAYGASIVDDIDMSVRFDLSKDAPQTVRIASQTFKKSLNLKEIFPTAVICTLIIFSTIGVSKFLIRKEKTQQTLLEEKLGPSKNMSASKLQLSNDKVQEKLDAFTKVRFKSRTMDFLTTIPDLLPAGTWIQSLDFMANEVSSTDKKNPGKTEVKNYLSLLGYSWAKTKREQFQLINNFLQVLKNDKDYKGYFTDIKLESVRSESLGEHEATSFKIKFQ